MGSWNKKLVSHKNFLFHQKATNHPNHEFGKDSLQTIQGIAQTLAERVKELIITEEEELIEINLPEFKKAVKQVKLLHEGKIQARPVSELIKEAEATF